VELPELGAQELVLFWKLANGTRCVVVQHGTMWQIRVIRHGDLLLSEDYQDPELVLARSKDLRLHFDAVA
jgi:hypothetical protein